ncbi:MAG: hypothetical protein ACTHU0_19160 [Kofleriaceae bacterium]
MANRTTYVVTHPKSEVQIITAKLQGGGAAANMVNAEAGNQGGGDVVSAVRTAAGKFTLTFRNKYPQLIGGAPPLPVGTTAGLVGKFGSIDVAAGTAALELYVGSTATDPATTDTVYIHLLVRNSGRNQ